MISLSLSLSVASDSERESSGPGRRSVADEKTAETGNDCSMSEVSAAADLVRQKSGFLSLTGTAALARQDISVFTLIAVNAVLEPGIVLWLAKHDRRYSRNWHDCDWLELSCCQERASSPGRAK